MLLVWPLLTCAVAWDAAELAAIDARVESRCAATLARVEALEQQVAQLAALLKGQDSAPAVASAPPRRALGVAEPPATGESVKVDMSPNSGTGAFLKAFDSSLHVAVGTSTSHVLEVNTAGVQVDGSVDATGTFNFYTSGGVHRSQAFATADGLTLHPMVGGHIFSTGAASSPTERMRILSSGEVGIGTSTPAQPLHILSTTPRIHVEYSGGGGSLLEVGSDALSAFVYNRNAQPLDFGTNNVKRMSIDANGVVDIVGDLLVGSTDTRIAANNLRFASGGAAYIDHSTVGQQLIFRTSTSTALDTTALTIGDTGNVDVGGGLTVTGDATIHGNLAWLGGTSLHRGMAWREVMIDNRGLFPGHAMNEGMHMDFKLAGGNVWFEVEALAYHGGGAIEGSYFKQMYVTNSYASLSALDDGSVAKTSGGEIGTWSVSRPDTKHNSHGFVSETLRVTLSAGTGIYSMSWWVRIKSNYGALAHLPHDSTGQSTCTYDCTTCAAFPHVAGETAHCYCDTQTGC